MASGYWNIHIKGTLLSVNSRVGYPSGYFAQLGMHKGQQPANSLSWMVSTYWNIHIKGTLPGQNSRITYPAGYWAQIGIHSYEAKKTYQWKPTSPYTAGALYPDSINSEQTFLSSHWDGYYIPIENSLSFTWDMLVEASLVSPYGAPITQSLSFTWDMLVESSIFTSWSSQVITETSLSTSWDEETIVETSLISPYASQSLYIVETSLITWWDLLPAVTAVLPGHVSVKIFY